MSNSLVKIGSYVGNVKAGIDLMPLIREDINDKLNINLSENIILKHISIFDTEDGNIYTINKFPFEIFNSTFSTAMIGSNVENVLIESIIPEQDGECAIYYLR